MSTKIFEYWGKEYELDEEGALLVFNLLEYISTKSKLDKED